MSYIKRKSSVCIMVIDSHIHISTTGKWIDSDCGAYIRDALKQMDYANIDRAIVLSLNTSSLSDNLDLAKSLTANKDRFYYFAHLDFSMPDILRDLEVLIVEHGFSGLKIHPRLHCIDPLQSMMIPVYEKAIELNIPVLICCFMQSNTIELEKFQPYAIDRLSKRFPELKIIMAHCGWPRIWDAYHVVKSNENVYMDISYILTRFRRTSLIKDILFMLETLDQKIIYGSDFPENSIAEYLSEFRLLANGLSLEKMENMCYKNILRIIGASH